MCVKCVNLRHRAGQRPRQRRHLPVPLRRRLRRRKLLQEQGRNAGQGQGGLERDPDLREHELQQRGLQGGGRKAAQVQM